MFSVATLTEEDAETIAQAYLRGGKNPKRMAKALGIEKFDLELLGHPLVRATIIRHAKDASQFYTLEEHLDKLKEIRDACLEGEKPNYKVALAAEVSLGKAAGLYDQGKQEDPMDGRDLPKLSTAEIRRLLMRDPSINGDLSAEPAQIEYQPESDMNEDGLA